MVIIAVSNSTYAPIAMKAAKCPEFTYMDVAGDGGCISDICAAKDDEGRKQYLGTNGKCHICGTGTHTYEDGALIGKSCIVEPSCPEHMHLDYDGDCMTGLCTAR